MLKTMAAGLVVAAMAALGSMHWAETRTMDLVIDCAVAQDPYVCAEAHR